MNIGDLVANLAVNTTRWTSGLGKAKSQFSTFGSGITAAAATTGDLAINTRRWTSGLNSAKLQFATFGARISSAAASIGAAIGAALGAGVSIKAFDTQLNAEKKLAAVLASTGGAAGLSATQIGAYASELQSLTNYGDEATIAVAAVLATFKEIKGDTFKETLAAAQDLSAVMGQDLQASVVQLGKALNDPIHGVSALAEVGVSFTQQQKDQIKTLQESGDILGAQQVILAELKSEFGGAAQAMASPLVQLKNTIGDVAENIGALMMPALSMAATAFNDLFGVVASGADTFLDIGIEAAVQLSSIGEYLVLAATQWELWFVQLGAAAQHFFTATVPAYWSWFADNWQNLFSDIAANTMTVFSNIGTNIMNAMTAIWDFIASGGTKSLELAWQPLTKGFIKTVDDLPDIPDRIVSDFEKSLAQSITDQGDAIIESQRATRDKLKSQFKPLETSDKNLKISALDRSAESGGDKAKESDGKTPEDMRAALRGSQEAAQLLTRGLGKPIEEKQLQELQKIAANTAAAAAAAGKNAAKPFKPKVVRIGP